MNTVVSAPTSTTLVRSSSSTSSVIGGGGVGGGSNHHGSTMPPLPPTTGLASSSATAAGGPVSASRLLFVPSSLERDESGIEEKLDAAAALVQALTANVSENEAIEGLTQHVCRGQAGHEDVTLGLLAVMLIEPPSVAGRYYRDLTLVTRDGMQTFIAQLLGVAVERYTRLSDGARQQLLWLARELIRNSVPAADNVVLCLLRQMQGGDVSARNVWLADALLSLLIDHYGWLEKHPILLATAVYAYLRLILDHFSSPFAALRQREVEFCARTLRERFQECSMIGRDLVRVLQNVARIPEFEALWRDLLERPTVLCPALAGGVSQLLSTRTPRRFLQSRVTPEMERKLGFLTHQVKLGQQRRYQEWFQKQYLSTPESQSLRCDLIRFICCIIHPSNEILSSDILPRWAVIGWLLMTCLSNVEASNCKMALFYDWLVFDPEKDNIMNIEPAILVMYHSIRPHPLITATLWDFLIRIMREFSKPLADRIRHGVHTSLRVILEKRVLPSLAPLFDYPRLDNELKNMIRENFAEFYNPTEFKKLQLPLQQQQLQQQQPIVIDDGVQVIGSGGVQVGHPGQLLQSLPHQQPHVLQQQSALVAGQPIHPVVVEGSPSLIVSRERHNSIEQHPPAKFSDDEDETSNSSVFRPIKPPQGGGEVRSATTGSGGAAAQQPDAITRLKQEVRLVSGVTKLIEDKKGLVTAQTGVIMSATEAVSGSTAAPAVSSGASAASGTQQQQQQQLSQAGIGSLGVSSGGDHLQNYLQQLSQLQGPSPANVSEFVEALCDPFKAHVLQLLQFMRPAERRGGVAVVRDHLEQQCGLVDRIVDDVLSCEDFERTTAKQLGACLSHVLHDEFTRNVLPDHVCRDSLEDAVNTPLFVVLRRVCEKRSSLSGVGANNNTAEAAANQRRLRLVQLLVEMSVYQPRLSVLLLFYQRVSRVYLVPLASGANTEATSSPSQQQSSAQCASGTSSTGAVALQSSTTTTSSSSVVAASATSNVGATTGSNNGSSSSIIANINSEQSWAYRDLVVAKNAKHSLEEALRDDLSLLCEFSPLSSSSGGVRSCGGGVANVRLLVFLVPEVYSQFASAALGHSELLHLVLSVIDAGQLQQLCCQCLQGELTMLTQDNFLPLAKASLQWETFEQMAFWSILQAHRFQPEWLHPLLPLLSFAAHQEACCHAMLILCAHKPTADLMQVLLSRDIDDSDQLVLSLLKHWAILCADVLAEVLSAMVIPQRGNRRKRQTKSQAAQITQQALLHLDQLRQSCQGRDSVDFFGTEPLHSALQHARAAASDTQRARFADLFALAADDESDDDYYAPVKEKVKARSSNRGSKRIGAGSTSSAAGSGAGGGFAATSSPQKRTASGSTTSGRRERANNSSNSSAGGGGGNDGGGGGGGGADDGSDTEYDSSTEEETAKPKPPRKRRKQHVVSDSD